MRRWIFAFAPLVLTSCAGRAGQSPRLPAATRTGAMTTMVREDRLKNDVVKLASFGTRHTLSDATSGTRGIGAAREWIAAELARVPGVEVARLPYVIPADGKRIPRDTALVDVAATLRGSMPAANGRL